MGEKEGSYPGLEFRWGAMVYNYNIKCICVQ